MGHRLVDFALTDEQLMIAETAEAFFAAHATSERTRRAMAQGGIDRALWAAFCGEMGFGGIGIPEASGGSGLGLVELVIVAEAAGRHVAALPFLGSLVLAAGSIARSGTDAQRTRWLPDLIGGDLIGAFVDVPHLNPADDILTAEDRFVVHGASADLFVVQGGSQAWVVPAGADGVSVEAQVAMDQTRPYARVSLSGAKGERLSVADASMTDARHVGMIALAAEALGGAQACLDRTVDYAKERIQFGRPIGSFQAYKHRLADMNVDIEQARSAVYWAACAGEEAAPDRLLAIHAAKSFAADTFFRCAGDMIQLHGGIGFTWEHDAHLFFKRARSVQSMLGSGDWHREEAARLILGEVS